MVATAYNPRDYLSLLQPDLFSGIIAYRGEKVNIQSITRMVCAIVYLKSHLN